MGDTRIWDGGRLGPYHSDKRYRSTGADLGHIYEAHNVETGAFALVLTPGRMDEWRPRGGWKKPPYLKGTAVEIRGGCWVQLKQDAPCPKSTAEYEGKCYMPVRTKEPEPRSPLP